MSRLPVLLLVLLAIPSFAAMCDDARIAKLKTRIQRIDQLLPIVPADESNYFEAEEASLRALRELETATSKQTATDYQQRYSKLASRRLYYVWQVRKRLSRVSGSISVLLLDSASAQQAWIDGVAAATPSLYKNQDADKLLRALASLEESVEFRLSLKELMIREDAQQDSFITRDNYGEFLDADFFLFSDVLLFAHCKLSEIAQPH